MLCSPDVDRLISSMDFYEDYISSDHKPLAATFTNFGPSTLPPSAPSSAEHTCVCNVITEWSRADDWSILSYQRALDNMLCSVDIPDITCDEGLSPEHVLVALTVIMPPLCHASNMHVPCVSPPGNCTLYGNLLF